MFPVKASRRFYTIQPRHMEVRDDQVRITVLERPNHRPSVVNALGNPTFATNTSDVGEYGIARKTGYKIFSRYEQRGWEGLSDRAPRPFRYANQLPEPVEAAIVAAKREKPHRGARRIRERLLRRLPHAIKVPAASTIHAVLDRHALVKPMGQRRAASRRHTLVPRVCIPTICGAPITRASSQ
jgi:hypothetical protein